jgi:two-component system chemotaxis response regulator CheY
MSGAKVLVIDDNADFREMVRLALEGAGYTVLEAADGLRGLSMIDHVEPDLVLLDVNMPNMSGPEFVEEICRRGERRPFGIVAMSGTTDAMSSPTKWFLAKPVDLDLLLGVVADFCGRRGVSPLWVREQQRESLHAWGAVRGRPCTP